MAKINYLGDQGKIKKFKRGGTLVAIFLILSFLMGIVGGAGAVMVLSSSTRLQNILGIKNSSLNINTTKSEKLRLEESSAIIDAAKKVTPTVVSITTTATAQDFFGRTIEEQGGGTGFIITNDGLILTNKHVAQAGDSLSVMTSEGKTYSAKTAALDPTNDLAILKIEASGLPVVDLGNSDDLQIGQWVIAVGNALGELQNTVTVGVISARERQITAGGGTSQQEQLNNLLQTDAAINSGNSGGPLVNLTGQVVGINTAMATNAQSIGFAIPINQAKSAIDSYKKSGKIIQPFLGVRYTIITKDMIDSMNLKVDHGALVGAGQGQAAVLPDSPAQKAGIKSGDILLEINGDRIDENHTLGALISNYKPGDEIEIKIYRDNKESSIKVKLGSVD